MKNEENTPIPIRHVEVKDNSLNKYVRITLAVTGLIFMLIGTVMIMSIILIFPGFGIAIMGFVPLMFGVTGGYTSTNCPSCDKVKQIEYNKEDFICQRCGVSVVIDLVEK